MAFRVSLQQVVVTFVFALVFWGLTSSSLAQSSADQSEPTITFDEMINLASGVEENFHPEVPEPPSQVTAPPLSAEMFKLRDRLRKTLALYYPKHLNTRDHSCWEVMHGIIAYGVDAKLFRNGPGGQKVNAVGWMTYNQPCHDEQLFYLDRGKLVARRGPGLQGHFGQFMAIVAQSHVPLDFPMKVSGKDLTLADLIEHEKRDCRDGEELTFKLIGLSHYLDSDDTWTTPDGEKWGIPRLIREELKQPVRGAACGGTHRLMGHSYALYKRKQRGKPIDGEFARAEKFIADYHKYAWSLQNPDGSFSTNWFKGREAKPDNDRRLKTTGHVLEWMVFSLPEEQLRDPRIVKTVNYIVTLLQANYGHEWEIGPQGHALHALRIYDRRLFKQFDEPGQPFTFEPAPATATMPRQARNPAPEVAANPKVKIITPPNPVEKPPLRTALKSPPITAPVTPPRLSTPVKPNPARSFPPKTVATPNVGPSTESSPATEPAPEVPPIEMAPNSKAVRGPTLGSP